MLLLHVVLRLPPTHHPNGNPPRFVDDEAVRRAVPLSMPGPRWERPFSPFSVAVPFLRPVASHSTTKSWNHLYHHHLYHPHHHPWRTGRRRRNHPQPQHHPRRHQYCPLTHPHHHRLLCQRRPYHSGPHRITTWPPWPIPFPPCGQVPPYYPRGGGGWLPPIRPNH